MWLFAGIPCGMSLIFMLDAGKKEYEIRKQIWSLGVGLGALLIGLWFLLRIIGKYSDAGYLITFCISAVIGVFLGFVFLREIVPMFQKLGEKSTKKTAFERNKKTDVREIEKHLPSVQKKFAPEKFFDQTNAFIGIDESGKEVFVDKTFFDDKTPHIQITGTSGCGKGVLIGVLATQWIKNGEAVFMIDPKDDEWGPHVFATAAKNAGVAHHVINMRVNEPQFSIFDGASADEIEELFISGFGLSDTGKASDFYSISDRKYAGIVGRAIAVDRLTAAAAYSLFAEELEKNAPKFAGKLRELGEVVAANAEPGTGISFDQIIEDGGSCYIVGHMRAEKIVRLQKMLLVRFIQIAEKRDRINPDCELRPVAIILDEVKYHLSKNAIGSLAAARDKGVHIVVAHQSISDLRASQEMDAEEVIDAIVENCKLKICYKVLNPDTADWLGRMSGKIIVDDESRKVQKNIALTEEINSERSIKQSDRYLVDENMMLHLPKKCAVVYGLGLAKFVTIHNVSSIKHADNVKIKAVKGHDIQKADDLI